MESYQLFRNFKKFLCVSIRALPILGACPFLGATSPRYDPDIIKLAHGTLRDLRNFSIFTPIKKESRGSSMLCTQICLSI